MVKVKFFIGDDMNKLIANCITIIEKIRDNKNLSWDEKYDLISDFSPPDFEYWCNPDASCEEDVNTYVNALLKWRNDSMKKNPEEVYENIYDACDQVCKGIENIRKEPGLKTPKTLLNNSIEKLKQLLDTLNENQ
jgi:hypothetical protein